MTLNTLATAGGLFAILVFVHFLVDWGFQTHKEAMAKSSDWKMRARHCAIYTVGFFPVMALMGFSWSDWLIGSGVLFFSHFAEDTYIPVYWWARYVRRIPSLRLDGVEAFKSEFGKPLGLLLFISIDQIIHLVFLWVLVGLAMT